jgi:hypothetical protein
MEWEDYEVTPTSRTRVHLQGLTRQKARELVPLARSWLSPAVLDVTSKGVVSQSYDVLDRAYHLRCADAVSALSFNIDASRSSPIVNLVLVIENWQGDALPALSIDKTAVAQGPDYRIGHRSTLHSEDLIIWIRLQAEKPVHTQLGGGEGKATGKAKS